ncbi:MAG: TolC family protein [Pirellulales bacterium]|nr:TolC family protein [Pirellulales bacterium]
MIPRQGLLGLLASLCAVLVGCKTPHPASPNEVLLAETMSCGITPHPTLIAAPLPVADQLAGEQSIKTLIQFALGNNPGIQSAQSRVDAAAARVVQAGSLKDPMLEAKGWPFFPNTPQTAAGRMTVDMMVAQEIPWRGKRALRAAAAQADVQAAHARLAAAELQTIAEVKLAYFDLYYIQRAIEITEQDLTVLHELIVVANSRYERVQTSQQDVLRLLAERDSAEGELIKLRQKLTGLQAQLASILHVSPETPIRAMSDLPNVTTNYDLELLYQQAIAVRPELQAMMAEIGRNRRRIDLAELQYYPDVTLKAGWGEITTNRAIAPSANGNDNVGLGLSFNLPLYRDKLAANVREAQSSTMAAARDYDQLKDATYRDIRSLYADALGQQELEVLLRESIIPKTEQALQVAISGYQVGEVEFADLLANWREVLQFHLSHLRLQTQLRQTIAKLERTVGGLPNTAPAEPEQVPPPLAFSN